MSQPLPPRSPSRPQRPRHPGRLLRPAPRSGSYLALKAMASAGVLLASACTGTGFTDFRPADPGPELRPEQWEGGGLQIDPGDLVAELVGDQAVDLTIRATALEPGDGAFVVELRSVDNLERVAADRVYYSLADADAQDQWTLRLPLPASVQQPAELVRYNVVVSTIAGGLWWTRSLVTALPFDGPRLDEVDSPWRAQLETFREQFEPLMEPLRASLVDNLSRNLEIGLEEMDRRGCPPLEFCERLDADYFIAMRRELARLHPLRDYWANPYRNEPTGPSEIAHFVSAGPDEVSGTSDDLTISIDYFDLDFAAAGLSEDSAIEHGPQGTE